MSQTNPKHIMLNAGAHFSKDQRSVDGFEMTFVTNHLSHYLLARLLLPDIAVGGRLVLTTSGTHDPAVIPIAPRTLDPEELAFPDPSELARSDEARDRLWRESAIMVGLQVESTSVR